MAPVHALKLTKHASFAVETPEGDHRQVAQSLDWLEQMLHMSGHVSGATATPGGAYMARSAFSFPHLHCGDRIGPFADTSPGTNYEHPLLQPPTDLLLSPLNRDDTQPRPDEQTGDTRLGACTFCIILINLMI